MYAPVALFCFNRPTHTMRTLEALAKNTGAPETRLIIYSDGPRNDNDDAAVSQIRLKAQEYSTYFKSMEIVSREKNAGLATSIINGVTTLTEEYGKVIVLEDDLLTSKHFLTFMNNALNAYVNDERVMHVSGYTYPVKVSNSGSDTFFLRIPMCWGWGTWHRAWKHFSKDNSKAFVLSQEEISYINFEQTFDYYCQHQKNQSGDINTWFIYWYMTLAKQKGFSLFPNQSLVANIGLDASGTHKTKSNSFDVEIWEMLPELPANSQEVGESLDVLALHYEYFKKTNKIKLHKKVLTHIARLINKHRP